MPSLWRNPCQGLGVASLEWSRERGERQECPSLGGWGPGFHRDSLQWAQDPWLVLGDVQTPHPKFLASRGGCRPCPQELTLTATSRLGGPSPSQVPTHRALQSGVWQPWGLCSWASPGTLPQLPGVIRPGGPAPRGCWTPPLKIFSGLLAPWSLQRGSKPVWKEAQASAPHTRHGYCLAGATSPHTLGGPRHGGCGLSGFSPQGLGWAGLGRGRLWLGRHWVQEGSLSLANSRENAHKGLSGARSIHCSCGPGVVRECWTQ